MTTASPHIRMQLAEVRKTKGITQEAMALRLGVSQTGLSYRESGAREVSLSNAVGWAAALGYRLVLEPMTDGPRPDDPIDLLCLPPWVRTTLIRYGRVYTVGDLTQQTRQGLADIRNLTPRAVADIEVTLTRYGLALKPEPEPAEVPDAD